MNRPIFILLILLLFFTQLNGQWISVEAAMGPGSEKVLEETESFSGDNVYGRIVEMDTFFIRYQYSGKLLRQRRLSGKYSVAVAARINFPINEKLTFSTGIGLESTSFRYRDVEDFSDYSTSRDTLEDFEPTGTVPISTVGGGGTGMRFFGFTEDGMRCDSFVRNDFTAQSSSTIITLRNNISNLFVPIDFSYDIIPKSLSLRLGAIFKYATSNNQVYEDIVRLENRMLSTDSLLICSDYYDNGGTRNSSLFSTWNVSAQARIEAQVKDYLSAFFSVSKSVTSYTNPGHLSADPNLAIGFEYRPTNFRIGFSVDLTFREKVKQRKTNYLFKSEAYEN